MHDVVDLATGSVVSTPGSAAPTASERASRLQRRGFPIDLLGTPSHRLSPKYPYQASPEGYLDAYAGDWSAGNDQIWWRLPATFDNDHPTVNAIFSGVAAGARVLTLDVEVWPYAGRTGTIVVFVGDTQAQIPVSSPTARTIDVSFTHDSSDPFTAMVELRQGVYDFVVHEVTLRSPGIVVTQQPPRA